MHHRSCERDFELSQRAFRVKWCMKATVRFRSVLQLDSPRSNRLGTRRSSMARVLRRNQLEEDHSGRRRRDSDEKESPDFVKALDVNRRAREPQTTMNRIALVRQGQSDPLLRLYLLGFHYLSLLEGVYDAYLRFLYECHLELPVTNAEIKGTKDRFEEDGVCRSLRWMETYY